jgi:Ca2+-binding EF-hand superfamily protein
MESPPGEELPDQEWPQEGRPTEDWPRDRPMLYYEGFGVMDFNRDGAIDKEEYDRAFRHMDSNGDSSIDTLEWKIVHGPEGEDEF